MNDIQAEAEALIADGFRVWPISRATRTPARAGFARVHGPVSARAEEFTDAHEVGVLCGPCDLVGPGARLVCVDYDGPVPADQRIGGGPTLTSKNGAHEWFRIPPGVEGFRQSQGVRSGDGWAVDTRDFGGYARETTNGEPLWDADSEPVPRDLTQAEVDALFGPAKAEAPATPYQPPANRTNPSEAWVASFIARIIRNPDGTNQCYAAAASALVECGWTNPEIAAAFTAWTPGHPEYPGRHLDSALRAADTRRAGGVIPGFPRLAELGIPWAAEAAPREDVASIIMAAAEAEPVLAPAGGMLFGARCVSAADIVAWDPPPIQWLSEALCMAPGAPSLISGYGGSGKTTFVQHLALAVATPGVRLLGAYPVRHGAVLHVDHEQGLDLTMRRYRRLGVTRAAQLDVVSFPRWSLADTTPEARKEFALACRGRALVIVDSFLASCAAFLEDENGSATREPLDFLGQVSAATGAVMLVIHHSKKDRSEKMTAIRGSSSITDAISLSLSYEKPELTPGARPILSIGKCRHEPPRGALTEDIEVVMTPTGAPADEEYTLTAQSADAVDQAKVATGVDEAAALLATGWKGSANALATKLKKRRADVTEIVQALRDDGIIPPTGPIRLSD